MRVFLCVFGDFSLAIPIDSVSSITLYHGDTGKIMEKSSENQNTYISLPLLFNYPAEKVKHGIILKNADDEYNTIIENRNILLTTEIECETNIPDEKIYSVPVTLKSFQFSLMFSGIIFDSVIHRKNTAISNTAENIILLLNPEKLVQNIKKEII